MVDVEAQRLWVDSFKQLQRAVAGERFLPSDCFVGDWDRCDAA